MVKSIEQPSLSFRIDGFRVESSNNNVDYDDDGKPEFIALSKARLRIFGDGFTEDLVIAFTEESGLRDGACLGASGGKFPVRKEGLTEHTAVVDILVPIASKTPYFICAKNMEPPMALLVIYFYFN